MITFRRDKDGHPKTTYSFSEKEQEDLLYDAPERMTARTTKDHPGSAPSSTFPDPTQIARLRSQGIEPPRVEPVFGSDLTTDLRTAQRARKHDLSVPSLTTTKTAK